MKDIADAIAAHRARNEALREVILSHHADLDEARAIDFFFYAGDRAAAQALADDLENASFESVHVSDTPRDEQWAITAVRNDSVTAITADAFVEQVVTIAARHQAELDGWGTAV